MNILDQIDNLFLIDINLFQKLNQNIDELNNYKYETNFYVFGVHENYFHLIQEVLSIN